MKDTYTIDGIEDKGNALIETFWGYFGGRPASIKEEEELKEPPKIEPSMHHVSDASGKMQVREVARGKLDKSKLVSDDAFIVDVGSMLYIWIGKGANTSEKREAMQWAVEYLSNNGRDTRIPMVRVLEGKEPPEFHAAMAGQCIGGRAQEAKKWKAQK